MHAAAELLESIASNRELLAGVSEANARACSPSPARFRARCPHAPAVGEASKRDRKAAKSSAPKAC